MKEKLTAKEVEHTGPGMYGDGGSPWLRFVAQERRSWLFRYQRQGKVRDMGFGPFPRRLTRRSAPKGRAAVQATRQWR